MKPRIAQIRARVKKGYPDLGSFQPLTHALNEHTVHRTSDLMSEDNNSGSTSWVNTKCIQHEPHDTIWFTCSHLFFDFHVTAPRVCGLIRVGNSGGRYCLGILGIGIRRACFFRGATCSEKRSRRTKVSEVNRAPFPTRVVDRAIIV